MISKKRTNLRNADEFQNLIHDYKDFLGKIITSKANPITLMHMFADMAKDGVFERYEPLIKHIISNYPDSLEGVDSAGRTSLHLAVILKRNKLVRVICVMHPNIISVLVIPTELENKDNCIHAAVLNDVTPEVAILLIKKASEETLCHQDFDGNTPLHRAAEFERCSEEQLEIVRTLAEQCNVAMKLENRDGDTKLSPYLHHLRTRTESKNLPATVEEQGRRPKQVNSPREQDNETEKIGTKYEIDLERSELATASSVQTKTTYGGIGKNVGGSTPFSWDFRVELNCRVSLALGSSMLNRSAVSWGFKKTS